MDGWGGGGVVRVFQTYVNACIVNSVVFENYTDSVRTIARTCTRIQLRARLFLIACLRMRTSKRELQLIFQSL